MKKAITDLRITFQLTQGGMYDLGVFLVGFFMPWLFSMLGDRLRTLSESSQSTFGSLILFALLIQVPAAFLKRSPLKTRLTNSGRTKIDSTTMGWFLFLYGLFSFFSVSSAVTALTDWGAPIGLSVVLILSLLCTVVMLHALTDTFDQDSFSLLDPKWELLANLLLIISSVIFAFTMWHPMVDEVMSGQGHIRREASGSITGTVAYGVVMMVPFGILFVAPRLLLLAEDFKSKATWIRFILIYLFAAWSMFYG